MVRALYSGNAYSAIVMGANGGIGAALVKALNTDERCTNLVALSRSTHNLDLMDEATISKCATDLSKRGGEFDLIVNAAGALEIDCNGPEKAFSDIDPSNMARSFAINAVGGALFLKHFMPLLRTEGRAVFATLSARVGSIGDNKLGGWMGYRASKAALNQIIRCAAVEQARRNPKSIVIALHPGTIKTPLTEKYANGRYTASPDECALNLLSVIAKRKPTHNGGFFDYAGIPIAW